MKTNLALYISASLVLGASAQYRTPTYTGLSSDITSGNTLRDLYSTNKKWSQDQNNNAFNGTWHFTAGGDNETDAEGSAKFQRGIYGPTTVWVHHNISGSIASVVNNSDKLDENITTVIVDDDAVITGRERALIMLDNHPNARGHGTWTMLGGTYVGGNNSEAFLGETMINYTVDSASFYAGAYSGSKDARCGIFTFNTPTATIANTRNNKSMTFKASDITGQSAGNGGAGVYITDTIKVNNVTTEISTVNMSGGGTFIGSQVTGSTTREKVSITGNLSGNNANTIGGCGVVLPGAVTINGTDTPVGYTFIGGQAGNTVAGGRGSNARSYGGHGAAFATLNGAVSNAFFQAGSAGNAQTVEIEYITGPYTYEYSADNSSAYAYGGSGLWAGAGGLTVNDSTAYGTRGGSATAVGTNSYADASGGNGLYTKGSITVNGGHYEGGDGGNAISRLGQAYAIGGSGLFKYGAGSVEINGGEFVAGETGKANNEDSLSGAGVRVIDGTSLTINGGTFNSKEGAGVWVENTGLSITENHSDTVINGDLVIINDINKNASILSGTITGDIYSLGTGTTTLSASSNAMFSGQFIQTAGRTEATITSPSDTHFFSDVILEDGTLSISGAEAVTKEDAKFDLGSATSELTFQNGVRLSDRTSINVNTGNLISGANLIMEDDTSLQINGGLITVAGDLIATNTNSEILTSAFATASTGTVHLATVGGNVAINNDTLKIDLGWLAKTNNINTTGGIWVNWEYNSVSNSIEGLTPEIAAFLDANLITNTSFAALNAGGKVPVEYAVSQMPDASETALNTAQQVNRQIAARGTEFRSMNGYASSKPRFGNAQPTGVAGPDGEKEKTMQGWIRAYGSKGDMDATANFSAYDSTSWGSVIGIDKTFGKLLVGIAGGFSRSDLDATAYDADIETYHGTAYSTFGGENIFIDLALTYGVSEIEESNVALGTTSFDADLISFYIGGGYSFNVKDKISLTPEASLLTTAYSQDAYERTVLGNAAVVQAYDATSYVGSLGVNVATIHQIDWLNQGIAMIPEIRLHYMHDFDADPDDFKYTLGGNTGAFAVRPRDEDMIRFGAGFDMWSWKRQNSKFEIDYDGLFSENYSEHILSGKITFKF